MKLDWSNKGRTRIAVLTALGTLVCIVFAFLFDSYSWETGTWRLGSDPINNILIPLFVAPPFFFFFLDRNRQLAEAHKELMSVASTDSLTSVLNRRAFTEIVDGYLKRVRDSSASKDGALLVIDVDNFKAVNDRFGHDTGDEALKLIASTIQKAVRDTDLVGRFGGEEFCVFIPDQSPDRVSAVAERIRSAIDEADFVAAGEHHHLSVSVGGVIFDRYLPLSDLYRSADERLYAAKHNGRNRVEMTKLPERSAPRPTMH